MALHPPIQPPADGPTAATLKSLRRGFSRGLSDAAADELVRTRQQGVDWGQVTQAAAEGLEHWYGWPSRPAAVRARRRSVWWGIAAGVLVYALLRPVLGVGHELLVAAIAWLLHTGVASNAWGPWLAQLPVDPVYTGAAIRSLGGVQVQGVAVAGSVGQQLHAWWPGIFLDNAALLLPGAGASMVAAPGAPALGRAVAAIGADAIFLAIGLLLCLKARRWPWLVTVGALIQAQTVVQHLASAQLAIADLNASGLPFALALLAANGGAWFTTQLAQLDPLWQHVVGGGAALLAGYGLALLLAGVALLLGAALPRLLFRRRGQLHRPAPAAPLAIIAAIAMLAAVSPIGAMAHGASNWQLNRSVAQQHAASRQAVRLADPGTLSMQQLHPRAPTPTAIRQLPDGTWQYLVNGQPQVIRGIGYNPQYANLSPDERQRLYDRDFSAMHALGINTIEGWFEDQFDEVTLDAAARNGIGVLLPFELNQDWNYADPAFQQQLLDRISAWVIRYRNEPALRMWAPGNENIHRDLYPNWVSKVDDPKARARAQAIAAFLPKVVDRIHQLDPQHPVVYRDAEDVYLGWLKPPFQDGVSRPWLMYGANVYTPERIQQIVNAWPSQWIGGPLLISEFAPSGVSGDDRQAGFAQEWAAIRSRPGVVIGGLAYTWATNGPEQLDRIFGMVDADGVPTDQTLNALSSLYLTDAANSGQ